MANRNDTEPGLSEQGSAEQDIPTAGETVHSSPPSSSIFSSAKLSTTNSNGNPFAVRVTPPSRPSEHSDSSSQSILAPSRLAAGGTAASEPKSKLILRPSALGSSSASKSPTTTVTPSGILRPATLVNPFAKATDNEDEAEPEGTQNGQQEAGSQTKETENTEPVSTAPPSISTFLAPSRLAVASGSSTSMSDSTAPAAASEDGQNSGTSSTSFPSLFSSTASRPESTIGSGFSAAPASSGFVFGQNLHERVANHDGAGSGGESTSTTSTAFSSGNLFSIPEKAEAESGSSTNGGKSLTESARELEAKASKRKYDEVTVVTGEEDEQNALQMNAKLCIFDKVQGWIERGRGTLRLNDKHGENQTLQSRLVMRTQGSLRVILNTKVWPEMTIDKASTKSIRMTAVDGDQIRVFLITASPKDTDTLFNAVEWRLATLRSQQARTVTVGKAPAAKEEECKESKKRRAE